ANSYTGATTVNGGLLSLQKSPPPGSSAIAVPGALVIGDSLGGPNADHVNVAQGEQIADNAAVTLASSGLLTIGGAAPLTETVGSLTMTGGEVDSTGAGATLALSGDVTATSGPGTTPARLAIDLSLGGATRTFTVADGPAPSDLVIQGTISNGGLTKAGPGTLQLGGVDNTYTGPTTVTAGLRLLDPNHAGRAVALTRGA